MHTHVIHVQRVLRSQVIWFVTCEFTLERSHMFVNCVIGHLQSSQPLTVTSEHTLHVSICARNTVSQNVMSGYQEGVRNFCDRPRFHPVSWGWSLGSTWKILNSRHGAVIVMWFPKANLASQMNLSSGCPYISCLSATVHVISVPLSILFNAWCWCDLLSVRFISPRGLKGSTHVKQLLSSTLFLLSRTCFTKLSSLSCELFFQLSTRWDLQ